MFNIYEMISFIAYVIIVLSIGFYFFGRKLTADEYILGGKRLGKWVTALSAEASDMSGWMLMGLPGAVYLFGLGEAWIAIGLAAGTILAWKYVAPRLRVYTGLTDSLTLPDFFEQRFGDPSGMLRAITAMITLFFFTIYTAAGLNAAAKLFELMFDVDFRLALIAGGLCIIFYTFLGGYLAVCWSDLLQGTLMLVAAVAVPVVAWFHMDGFAAIETAARDAHVSLSLWPQTTHPLLAIVSASAWGLGYFGMPHILARFMSVDSVRTLRPAMYIAVGWVILCLGFAVAAGLIGMAVVPGLVKPMHEAVFIEMIRATFPPVLSGVFLTAILAAIMSTIDSQLLVSASVLAVDFNRIIVRRPLSDSARILMGRLGVGAISAVALIIASDRDSSILRLVEYAWGGLGAAFGPVVLMALYSRKTSWRSALLGMCAGSLAAFLWEQRGYGVYMYEIVPGFLANLLAIHLGNHFWPERDPEILRRFEDHVRTLRES